VAAARKKTTSKKPKTTRRKTTSRKPAQRKTKRLSPAMEVLLYRLQRFGTALAVLALILWLASWLVLSGSLQRGGEWARQQFLAVTADWGLVVDDILLEGREYASADVLLALINIRKGDPLFALDPVEAAELIKRIDWVKSVRVERRFPGTVYIAIEERQPLALWQKDRKLHLLDQDGEVISTGGMERFKDLIIVIGDDAPRRAPDLIEALGYEPAVKDRVEAASLIGDRRWNLSLDKGQEVKLPEDDMALALKSLADAQSSDGLMDKDVMSIDLREPGRIVVRPRAGAVQEYKSSVRSKNNGDDI